MCNEPVINVELSRWESMIKHQPFINVPSKLWTNSMCHAQLTDRLKLPNMIHSGWYVWDCKYICWHTLLFKTSLTFFSALDICDEAVGVIQNLSYPSPPQLKWEPDREEKRVVGHSSFYHLSTTHAWLRGFCKLGGLHDSYQDPSKKKKRKKNQEQSSRYS